MDSDEYTRFDKPVDDREILSVHDLDKEYVLAEESLQFSVANTIQTSLEKLREVERLQQLELVKSQEVVNTFAKHTELARTVQKLREDENNKKQELSRLSTAEVIAREELERKVLQEQSASQILSSQTLEVSSLQVLVSQKDEADLHLKESRESKSEQDELELLERSLRLRKLKLEEQKVLLEEARVANLLQRSKIEDLNLSGEDKTTVEYGQKVKVIRPRIGKNEKRRSDKSMKVDKAVEEHHSRRTKKRRKVPKGHVLVKTQYGDYAVKDYDALPEEEQKMCRSTFDSKFIVLNESSRKMNLFFTPPTADETLYRIDVRFQQAVRVIKSRNGMDLTKIGMIATWAVMQYIMNKLDLDAEGYFTSQLQMYEVYENKLIELGEIHGFGQDWPAWMQIAVISVINLVVVVLMNTWLKDNPNIDRTSVMRSVSSVIVGKMNASPIPTEESSGKCQESVDSSPTNPMGSIVSAMGGMGNIMGMFTGMGGGGQRQKRAPKSPLVVEVKEDIKNGTAAKAPVRVRAKPTRPRHN